MPRLQILSLPERLPQIASITGKGVCIAFIDSAFYPHPDLVRPVRRIRAFADVTRPTPLAAELVAKGPWSWHGTMTACCAAGSGYLSGGRYRGLASGSEVVLIKAGDDTGGISGRRIADAIRLPLRHPELGVRVLSISAGVDTDDPDAADVERAVKEASDAGIVVIAAAGNSPGEVPTAPASAREAITVGGQDDGNTADPGDDRPWPSSYGSPHPGIHKPDLLAPAFGVPAPMLPGTQQHREAPLLFALFTLLEEICDERKVLGHDAEDPSHRTATALLEAIDGRMEQQKYIACDYQHADGTSFATPIVASVVAQMLEAAPDLSPGRVREILLATARPLDGVPRAQQGAGVIDPERAVRMAQQRSV